MIVEIIAKYLEANKRLVVPNLGAFIVKVPAQTILFSNLIKSDDGVLRTLLGQSGLSELDAAALVDRFVFEVNYRLEHSGVCALDGFGVFRSGANGTISFTYDTSAKGDVLDGDADEKIAAQVAEITAIIEPVIEPVVEATTEPSSAEEQPAPQPAVVEQSEEEEGDGEDAIDIVPRCEKPVVDVEREVKRREAERDKRRREQYDYVKGLRYGKGRKVVTGREGATSRKSSKGMMIIYIAIFAALLAIAALAYGLYNDWKQSRDMYEGLYDEPAQEQPSTTIEEGVPNPDLEYITPKEN